jgi:DNA-binding winged helix-turn-helix (wHTH) protein/predicted ATPase
LEVAFPPYRLDLTNERLWRADQEIRLRPKTFAVLRYLVDRPGRLVAASDLLRSVWPDVTVSDSMPRLCIREIRAALRDDARRPRYLETRVGRGYRFVAPVHPTLDPGTAAHPPTPGTPIVGRDAERARLEATLARVREGRRAIVFVTGEPGIGKTTLVEAFLASEPAAARVGLGQCVEPYGRGDPYLPLIEALERLGRSEGGRSVADAMQRWAPTWLRQASALLDPAEREVRARRRGSTTPRGMLRELAAFLEALTQERELIIWLEDLHWADASTLEAIAFLARRREPARLFLVATYRPAELGTADHPLLRLTRELVLHRFAEELALGPLTETAVGEYLAGRLGASVSPELTRYVHTRTEGNPLFIVTVVDDLLNRAAIEQANGAWTLRRIASEPGEVPDTLRQLLELQTERLSAADRRLLEVSSVAGVEFSTAAVAASLGQPILSVEARLASLARLGQFIRARGPGRWPDGTLAHRFAFIHALYQQVLYTAIPAARASEWHGRIGACLEAAYGARAFEIASELAMHCERARDTSGALRYFRLAGETALDRTAHGEAIAHLSHALALVGELPEGLPRTRAELEVLVTLGPAWIVANGYAAPEVERTYERALAACRRLGAPRELARVLQGLWNVRLVRGHLAGAHALARELLVRARRRRDAALLARAHAALGETCFHRARLPEARRHLGRALALTRRHTPSTRRRQDPRVAAYASWGLWMAGSPDQARTLAREALAEAAALGHPHNRAFALGFSGFLAQFCGEDALVAERAAEQLALCREYGIPYWLSWGVMLEGWVLARQGKMTEGLARMREGLLAYRATGAEVGVPHFLVVLAEGHAEADRVEEAGRLLDEAMAVGRRTGNRYVEAEHWRVRARLLDRARRSAGRASGSGASDTPEGSLRRALALTRRQGMRAFELRAATALSRLWRDQGRVAEARRLLGPLCRWFTEGADTADVSAARALLAEISEAPRPSVVGARRGSTGQPKNSSTSITGASFRAEHTKKQTASRRSRGRPLGRTCTEEPGHRPPLALDG